MRAPIGAGPEKTGGSAGGPLARALAKMSLAAVSFAAELPERRSKNLDRNFLQRPLR